MPTGQAGKHMPRGPLNRRDFISCLGGAAAWPLAARAQPADQMRRIGVLTVFSKDDPEGQRRIAALLQRLQELGWADGRNVRIEFRWAGGDPDQSRFYAGELVGMKPDVILVNNALVMPLLQKETHIIPIVFVAISDPVVAGIVTNLARPGGNITGFTTGEYEIGGKRLEVLKEVVPEGFNSSTFQYPWLASASPWSLAMCTAPVRGRRNDVDGIDDDGLEFGDRAPWRS